MLDTAELRYRRPIALFWAAARSWQAGLVLLFIVAFAYSFVSMVRVMDVYDEGIMLVGGDMVAAGFVPHRDFYTQYGPADFYMVAGFYRLIGHTVLSERVWDCTVRGLLVAAVYAAARRLAPWPLALWAAAVVLAWQGFLLEIGNPVLPALTAVVASLALFLSVTPNLPSPRSLVLAGACMGVATLFRYDVGLVGCGLAAVSIAAAHWIYRAGGRTFYACAAAPLPYLAGFGAILLPVALYFVWCGAVPDLAFDFLTATKLYARMRSLPLPGLDALRADPSSFGVYLPLVICAAALVTMPSLVWPRTAVAAPLVQPQARIYALQAMILTAFTLVFCVKGFVRVSNLHMCMALVVSCILLARLAAAWPVVGVLPRVVIGISFGLTVALAAKAAETGWSLASWNIAWAAARATWEKPATWQEVAAGPCRMPHELKRMACLPVDRATADTVRYISIHTLPADRIFVGLPRHDQIVLNDIAFYFAAGRLPSTKWYHYDPGIQTSAPIQREMVSELERAPPKLIVIENTFQGIREPNESARSSGVTILDEYVKRAFRPVAKFDRYQLMVPVATTDPR